MDMRGPSAEMIGPYRLLREISADPPAGPALGSVPAPPRGQLHEAVDTATGQRVALRLRRHPHASAGAGSKEGLRDRLRVAAGLRHPNLVAVHGAGWAEGAGFVASEWIEGAELLRDYLARSGPLPLFQRLALVVQMLSALAFVHDSGRVHGTLDWDDLLVSRTGQLKVAGFGWAETTDAGRDLQAAALIAAQLLQGFPQEGADGMAGRGGHGGCPPALVQVLHGVLAAPAGSAIPTAAQLSQRLQAACGRPAWSGDEPAADAVATAPVPTPSAIPAPAMPRPGPAEPARPLQPPAAPSAAPPSPAAVLSSARAQRIELGLAAACLAAVAWAANLLVGAAPGPALPVPTELRATGEVPPPAPARLAPAVPAAAAPLVPLAPPAALPAVADVPAPVEPSRPLPGPRHVQDVNPARSAVEPPASVPPPHPPAGADRRARLPAPVAQPSSPPAPVAQPSSPPVRTAREATPKPAARTVARVAGPEWRCQHGLALTRDLCVALYCQAAEYRLTPSCMRLHAQGRRVTGMDAQSHGGT